MKKLMMLTILLGCYIAARAQDTVKREEAHAMLIPDSNTVYYDEYAHVLSGQAFSDKIAAGHYHFKPELADGKLKSMTLVKVEGSLRAGAPMPDFSVKSLGGKTYRLSQLRGKTVVLNFWFTACVPCREEMPGLNDLVKSYHNNPDVLFIAITFDEALKVSTFLKSQPFDYCIAPGQAQLIKTFGIAGYPTNVVIDKFGKVAFLLATYSPDNVAKLAAAVKMISKQ